MNDRVHYKNMELNDKHREFARRLLVDTTTPQYQIYKEIYGGRMNDKSAGVAASQLKVHPTVQKYLAELREEIKGRFMVTVEDLLAELEEARQVALEERTAGPAVSATMGKAKLCGLDKQIVDHTSSDGSMRPTIIQLAGPEDDDDDSPATS